MSYKVLLIDDEPPVRESVRNYLEDYDYQVFEAGNGREGVELFDQVHPDVVLVDLRMPVMDGLQVMAHLGERSGNTPVIVVSGTGAISDVIEALRGGAWDYMLKPVHDMDLLRESIEHAMARARRIRDTLNYQAGLEDEVEQRNRDLEKANEQLRLTATAFDTHEPIAITDRRGRFIKVNQAFVDVTGYTEKDIIGQDWSSLQSPRHDRDFRQQVWRSLMRQQRWQGEVWNLHKNGEERPEWVTISAVRDDDDAVTHYVMVFVDLFEVKKQQRDIERAAAEEHAVGRLLRLALTMTGMDRFLDEVVETLLHEVPWLALLPSGGIFLTEQQGSGQVLELKARKRLNPKLYNLCEKVKFGQCLCGIAAAEGKVQFAHCVDHRHSIRYEGISPHGHYNVPIIEGDKVLGVLVLYLPHGHVYQEHEQAFLERVAVVISMGISKRYTEQAIEHQAYHDGLTGLPNRSLLQDRLDQALATSRRENHFGAVMFLDLDHFKNVNDSLGHSAGDELLQEMAARINGKLREGDTVARIGGDEFVVLLPKIGTSLKDATNTARLKAEILREVLARPVHVGVRDVQVTGSLGVVLFPDEDKDPGDILKHADTAMYRTKSEGRNGYRFYQAGMQAEVERRLAMEADLHLALERNELELYYQAQVDGQRHIVGAEALLRWHQPERGTVSPAEFIPVAEETGLIKPISEWILMDACSQLHAWSEQGLTRRLKHLSINVSPKCFSMKEFVGQVEQVFADTAVDPKRVSLELTEGILIDNAEDAIAKMKQLKAHGVRFSIDDFGTGYSALSYLTRLPLDQLKIDRSFVQAIGTDSSASMIVKTILAMASHIGLEVVAEGVETGDEFAFLDQQGCDLYQGFRFSRPVPASEFGELLSIDRPVGPS